MILDEFYRMCNIHAMDKPSENSLAADNQQEIIPFDTVLTDIERIWEECKHLPKYWRPNPSLFDVSNQVKLAAALRYLEEARDRLQRVLDYEKRQRLMK